jgi:hypothetical protein
MKRLFPLLVGLGLLVSSGAVQAAPTPLPGDAKIVPGVRIGTIVLGQPFVKMADEMKKYGPLMPVRTSPMRDGRVQSSVCNEDQGVGLCIAEVVLYYDEDRPLADPSVFLPGTVTIIVTDDPRFSTAGGCRPGGPVEACTKEFTLAAALGIPEHPVGTGYQWPKAGIEVYDDGEGKALLLLVFLPKKYPRMPKADQTQWERRERCHAERKGQGGVCF